VKADDKPDWKHILHCFELQLKSITPPKNRAQQLEAQMIRQDIRDLKRKIELEVNREG